MKTLRLLSWTLIAIALAFLCPGCASVSQGPMPVRPVQLQARTYAVVATDNQGILSQTELEQVEDSLVQFLLDQGYVRGNQTLVDDPARADVIFQIKIAWNAPRTSFAIVDVSPCYGGGGATAGPPPAYATAVPPPPDDDVSFDPWSYGDEYSYAYGPYCLFPSVYYFGPWLGFEHHRRHFPPTVYRPPRESRPHPDHRPSRWTHFRTDGPSWYGGTGHRPPVAPSRNNRAQSGRDHSSPTVPPIRSGNSGLPGNSSLRPRDGGAVHPENPGASTGRPPGPSPRQIQPVPSNRSAPIQVARPPTGRPSGTDRRPPPEAASPRREMTAQPPAAVVPPREQFQPQRATHPASAPVRETGDANRSHAAPPAAPPRADPPHTGREGERPSVRQEPAAPPRADPPPQRQYSPPPPSVPSPAHSVAPAPQSFSAPATQSVSRSGGGESASKSKDR